MIPLETREIRGLSIKAAMGFILGWSSLMATMIMQFSSIRSEIRDNKKDSEVALKMMQYQVDNIRQTTELNSIQIQDLKKERVNDEKFNNQIK